ncbi:hypothetical protein V565_089980 [Rhizoctonia solani 123E]|nr:hypothetical protein V565_089980 [Rhizoctonia solani 123E]
MRSWGLAAGVFGLPTRPYFLQSHPSSTKSVWYRLLFRPLPDWTSGMAHLPASATCVWVHQTLHLARYALYPPMQLDPGDKYEGASRTPEL